MNWWKNCAATDVETKELDDMESVLAPLPKHVRDTRALISDIECCHHKAERWVDLIVDAIGSGKPGGRLGSRTRGQRHPKEVIWSSVCDELNAWLVGRIDEVRPVVLDALGVRNDVKAWQVERVEHRVRSHVGWPEADDYVFLVEPMTEDLSSAVCPGAYTADEDLWRKTVDTILHESAEDHLDEGGYITREGYLVSANISLAVAIDMLWPCNWNFEENVLTVLEAIGGKSVLARPYAACARNIRRAPIRPKMVDLCHSLNAYGNDEYDEESPIHRRLGSVSPAKRWLSRSLAKTIKLQLYI